VVHFGLRLLLVLGQSNSAIIAKALEHISGAETSSFGPTHTVLDRIMVSAVRAVRQVNRAGAMTAAGREMKIRQLAVEFNALYTVEQLLLHSKVIRGAVRRKELEVHMGILNSGSGEVDFLGTHPMQQELLQDWQPSPPSHGDGPHARGAAGQEEPDLELEHVHGPGCSHHHG